jgi:Domain of unknown function (DUF4062)
MPTTIFVSSTCYDLVDVRSEIENYLKEKEINYKMSDKLDSDFIVYSDTNSIQTCLLNIDSSDIVILILSQRYGPSLKNCGFDDFSATHLEYKRAILKGKHIILFLRDSLITEWEIFKNNNQDFTKLTWLKPKDARLFEIIEEHKKLTSSNKNNWFWKFSSSVCIKKRLDIELNKEIFNIKLEKLINSGNAPFLSIFVESSISSDNKSIEIKFQTENLGIQPAIDPIILFYNIDSYDKVEEGEKIKQPIAFGKTKCTSLKSLQKFDIGDFSKEISELENNDNVAYYIIEAVYRTIIGDVISDITLIKVETGNTVFYAYKKNIVQTQYIKKRYRSVDFYNSLL